MQFKATQTIAKFKCLQADCPDTCCKGWSMQLDDKTFAKYKGTELENAIAYDGQNHEIRVMKRDQATDHCVKLVDGICGIHAQKGESMLGDACSLYPRVIRKFGEEMLMTGTLSCPEIVRLSIENNEDELIDLENSRIPIGLKDYFDSGLSFKQIIKINRAFLDACNSLDKPEKILARIYSAAQSLGRINIEDWDGAGLYVNANLCQRYNGVCTR